MPESSLFVIREMYPCLLHHKLQADREAYIAFKSVNAGLGKQFA